MPLSVRTTRHRETIFSLQERRGHGESSGFFNRIVGTIDSIRDSSRTPPFRYGAPAFDQLDPVALPCA
jgi:hypothetical protein